MVAFLPMSTSLRTLLIALACLALGAAPAWAEKKPRIAVLELSGSLSKEQRLLLLLERKGKIAPLV